MDVVLTNEGFQVKLPDGQVIREVTVQYPTKASEYQRTQILREKMRQTLIQINNQPPKALLEWRKNALQN